MLVANVSFSKTTLEYLKYIIKEGKCLIIDYLLIYFRRLNNVLTGIYYQRRKAEKNDKYLCNWSKMP